MKSWIVNVKVQEVKIALCGRARQLVGLSALSVSKKCVREP